MATFVLPADRVHETAALCDYLVDRLDSDDTVHAVSTASPQASRDSDDAQNAIYSRLGAIATVDRHTESADAQTQALSSVAERTDADEIVVGYAIEEVDERDFDQFLSNATCPVVIVPDAAA